jgi:hypothetical protein
LKYGMRGKKRLSTREKFKGDLLWKHYVLSFVSFLCCFYLHVTEYEQMRVGGAKFSWAQGRKYLNTGLVPLHCRLCCNFPGIKLPSRTGIYEFLEHFWTRHLLKRLIDTWNRTDRTFMAPHIVSNMVI